MRHFFMKSSRLPLSWLRSLSNRNQPINLLRKSMDWFLYERKLGHKSVKLQMFKGQTSQSKFNRPRNFYQKLLRSTKKPTRII